MQALPVRAAPLDYRFARIGRTLATLVATWRARARARRALRGVDDAVLRDIGLPRSQASFEADKPFWRE